MKSLLLNILFVLSIIGCDNHSGPQQLSHKDVSETDGKITADHIEIEQAFDIIALIDAIDSINYINSFTLDSTLIDTIDSFYGYYPVIEIEDSGSSDFVETESLKEKNIFHPLFAFSPTNANYLYEYGTFSVLQFKNDSLAKSAFTEIFELFINDDIEFKYTSDSVRLYNEVFSKGGASFFRKNEFIIHKYRRCNDNFRVHENNENSLIDYLYRNKPHENSAYFMRYCCSCPQGKNFEHR